MSNPFLSDAPSPQEEGEGNFLTRAVSGIKQAAAHRGGYVPLAVDLGKLWLRQTSTALYSALHPEAIAVPGSSVVLANRYGPDYATNPDLQNDLLFGAANVATFGVGSALGGVPAAAATKVGGGALTRLAVKGATFAGLEALGGATYGAIAPTPEGESKLQSMGENAAVFAATAGIGGAIGQAAKQARGLPELLRSMRPTAPLTEGVTRELETEAATLSALKTRTPAQLARLQELSVKLQEGAGELPPPATPHPMPPVPEPLPADISLRERMRAEPPAQLTPSNPLRTLSDQLPQEAAMQEAARQVAEEIHPIDLGDGLVQQSTAASSILERQAPPSLHDLGFPQPLAPTSAPTSAPSHLQRWIGELQRLSTEQLQALSGLQVGQLGGAVAKHAGVRVGATALGSGALALSEDPNLSPTDRSALRLIGGAFVLGGTGRYLGSKFAASGFGRQVLESLNPLGQVFDPTLRRAATGSLGFHSMGAASRQVIKEALENVLPRGASEETLHSAMIAIEQGDATPHLAMFNTEQQEVFRSLKQLHDWMGTFGQQVGFWDEYRDNYISLLFPKQQLQRESGLAVSAGTEGFLKESRHWTFEQATAWARRAGHAPPIADPRLVVPAHIESFFRAATRSQLADHLRRLGALIPSDIKPGLAGNTQLLDYAEKGWRRVEGVRTLPDHLAPTPIAALLEHVNGVGTPPGVIARAYDKAQGVLMRVIMWNAAIHGANVLRGAASLDGGVAAYSQYWQMVSQADPVMLEAARSGAAVFGRSDLGPRLRSAMDAALTKAHGDAAPTINKLKQLVGPAVEWNDHVLWNRAVPALGLHAWGTQMLDWAERTGGRYLVGSPEYAQAARSAAEFANKQMGLTEPLIRSAGFSSLLRRIFFAPNWMMSRISLMTNAYGQAADVLEGRINPLNAAYLQQRVRMLAVGAALTYAGSRALSGQDPEFNEKTQKFYMRTGQVNPQTGRELGIDLLGWWQDDTKAMNNPMSYLVGKLNPLISLAGDVFSGRDFAGRELSAPEQITNIINSTPIGSAVGAAGAAASGNQADLLKNSARLLGAGGASALPRPMDATIGALAQRLLTEQNIPATDDRTRELALLLRGNILKGRPLISTEVMYLLANDRRQQGAGSALWMEARNVVGKWASQAKRAVTARPAARPTPTTSNNPFLVP